MNDSFKNLGKTMPYQESDDYIDALIDRSVKQALDKVPASHLFHPGHKRMIWASIAAVVLLAVGIRVTVKLHDSQQPQTVMTDEGPIDQFLNSISDEEAAQLLCFEIEEIPEY